ncbi:MAG TPA: hypothetical protein VGB63_16815 [Pedobacter sp.]|jgi:hypothetical protein
MKQYRIKYTKKGGGYHTETIVHANSTTDARRIIKAQFGDDTSIVFLEEVR